MISRKLILAAGLMFLALAAGWYLQGRSSDVWGLMVAVTGASSAILVALIDVANRIRNLQHQASEDRLDVARLLAAENHSLQNLAMRFPGISMPVSTFSMRGANLEAIVDILVRRKPKTVVELGSGFSTLIIASWLRKEGQGRVIAFEHDSDWAEKCVSYLRRNCLQDVAEVRLAALALVQVGAKSVEWYDLQNLIDDLPQIDLLIVDGPPSGSPAKPLARIPAVDVFYDRLSKDAVIFLDDTGREGEQFTANYWASNRPDLRLSWFRSLSGYCLLERGAEGSFSTPLHWYNVDKERLVSENRES